LYITEYGFDGESPLKDNDFNSIILGNARWKRKQLELELIAIY
jgi:hypothetical protein